jgi:hypothetical protein
MKTGELKTRTSPIGARAIELYKKQQVLRRQPCQCDQSAHIECARCRELWNLACYIRMEIGVKLWMEDEEAEPLYRALEEAAQ